MGLRFPVWLFFASLSIASGVGWKPIPPPPGLYIGPYAVRGALQDAGPPKDHGFGDDPIEIVASQEDYRRKQHKFEAFPKATDDFFIKEAFKSPPTIYEGVRKRPTPAFASYVVPGKKPGKIFHDKGGIKYVKGFKSPFLGDFHHVKVPGYGGDNEVAHSYGQDDQCPLYKVSFRQDLYFQYIQYKVHMPELKEFTICLWSKFHNHSQDHPLFSYAVRHQPKAIYMWVSNTERSNYYNMKINGHPILRLNYPIRLNKWYHTCQSWNSKTGEWQVWVNGQRIGRGFHNLLVGHTIPGGGIAISGQEQLQYGGGFLEAADTLKGAGGLLGEITMFQLYRIALSAGKAYTDHRHHHSLYTSTTPEPPEIPTEEPLPTPEHPFLENGQLKRPLKVFELAESLRTKGNTDTSQSQPAFADFFDGHLVNSYHLGHALAGNRGNALSLVPYAEHPLFKRQDGSEALSQSKSERIKFVTNPGHSVHVDKIRFGAGEEEEEEEVATKEVVDWSEKTARGRRSVNDTNAFVTVDEEKSEPSGEEEEEGEEEKGSEEDGRVGRGMAFANRRPFRQTRGHVALGAGPLRSPHNRMKTVRQHPKRDAVGSAEGELERRLAKKQVVLGDFHFHPPLPHELGYLPSALPALPAQLEAYLGGRKDANPKRPDPDPLNALEDGDEDSGPAQPEPAEDEVRRIMRVCSGCGRDPYRKVAIISWRSTPKKLYSGALFLKARSECKKF